VNLAGQHIVSAFLLIMMYTHQLSEHFPGNEKPERGRFEERGLFFVMRKVILSTIVAATSSSSLCCSSYILNRIDNVA
jgi:hypothetical protein